MKKIKLCYLSILFVVFNFQLISQTGTKTITCLFLGNSYTYVNDLPLLIDSLAKANGDDLVYDQNTPGGHTFNNHFNNATSLAKINLQAWQYVVLQAQSQEPSFSPAQVNVQTLPFAIKLDSAINQNNTCSQTVFYQTWGRKFGDASNCGFYPPVCTYTGMQNRLRASYKLFADTTKSIMSPVGEAFRASISYSPALDLYSGDQSHPSMEGSYLAACVFYEVLFKKSVINNSFKAGLANNVASHLQLMANKTVNDSLLTWNIGVYEPHAAFTFSTPVSASVQFSAVSTTTLFTHKWYFGDGSTSTTVHPSKSYSASGTYTISHVVKFGCSKDSISKVVTITPTAVSKNVLQTITLKPNPVKDRLFIDYPQEQKGQCLIYDLQLKLIAKYDLATELNLSHLNPGTYFLEIVSSDSKQRFKFIKE
ncbi:MAG: DUF4886 domain-containing protein [Bacteroidota bacterium]